MKKIINKDFVNNLISDLDTLCRKLQDNYNDGKKFVQTEEDRVALYNAIELLNEYNEGE